MPRPRNAFTLVEVVVVIAVVALLSAIIVPLVARQIDAAKTARAQNECQVIAATILQFYKDVGVAPALNQNGQYVLTSLVSGSSVYAISTSSTGISYGYTSTANDNWYDGGVTSAAGLVDNFDNHLNTNTPETKSTAIYPTTGEIRWKGPYLPKLGMDPWGRPYCCNIVQMTPGNAKQCVVISAGPDGAFDTDFNFLYTTTGFSGDDVGAIVGNPRAQ